MGKCWPPTDGISTPLPMEYRPPTYGISNPLLWYYELLSFGRNEGDSKCNEGIQNTMTKNWPRGQNIIWKIEPGVKYNMKIDPGVNLPWDSKHRFHIVINLQNQNINGTFDVLNTGKFWNNWHTMLKNINPNTGRNINSYLN